MCVFFIFQKKKITLISGSLPDIRVFAFFAKNNLYTRWGCDLQLTLSIASEGICNAIAGFFKILVMVSATPTIWNHANVTLVWQNMDDKLDDKNYQPTSLLSWLRIDFDVMLRPALDATVTSVVDVAQGGFQQHRSTMNNVLTLHVVTLMWR